MVGLVFAVVSCSNDDASSPESSTSQAPSASTGAPKEDVVRASEPDPEPEPTSAPSPDTAPESSVPQAPEPARSPALRALSDEGEGTIEPLASAPLPNGYSESEYVISGDATSYEASGALGTDGVWDATESGTVAPYSTRIIARTPPADQFSGVVLVEWMNVTAGTDTTPDWGFLHEMIGREGHAYVAVSAQFVGVMGDDESFIDGDIVDTRGLAIKDPARYGGLDHPGDEYAYDIFTQAGVAVAQADVLGGLEAASVIALGESQSAFFMTTYVNAIHPLVDLYDGFLVHSRGASATNIDGSRSQGDAEAVDIRTDLNAPVLQYETETDIFELGFLSARQPDSDSVRTWEVAGTAHADAYTLFASGLPRDPASGSILGCSTPINDGPQHETLAAAVHHLVAWVVDGTPPPTSPLLDVDGESFVRDDLGIVTGGIRTPVVDAPLRVLSGEPGPDGGSCFLFGQTVVFDDGVVSSLYADLADWSTAAQASAQAAIEAGWLLPDDAATMIEEGAVLGASLGLE
jgi:Alpha/beta hydrolase domain